MFNLTSGTAPRAKKDLLQRKFNQSEDNALVKEVRETHNADTHYLVDVKPILLVIEDILRRVAPGVDAVINGTHDALDEKASVVTFDEMLDGQGQIIHNISCEIFCKCSGDLLGSTMALFKMLSNYPWEAKVILTLAGFAATYGEFWLVAQLCTTNPLAKAVAHLKQIPGIIENSQAMKPQLEAINKLLNAIVNVTKRIIEFNKLPTEYLSQDSAQVAVAKAHIPAAAYWTIRSIVACGLRFASLTDFSFRYENTASTTEVWELSSLAHKLSSIRDLLAKELDSCRRYIEERKYEEEYKNLIRLLEIIHLDNMKVLKALISVRDDSPLVFGSTKARVSIDGLRRKHVLLLISDLDLSHDEILVLHGIYDMRLKHDASYNVHAKDTPYELVWLPVVDRISNWHEGHQKKFSELLAMMPWHCVHSPQIIEPHVIKYIREKWHFDRKLIIVSLDPQGKVISTNAMHMMWIWGNAAFPFSHEKEEALWDTKNWTLNLLVDDIEAELLQWIAQGKYICLYGGDNIEWIREFTNTAKTVAQALGIQLEMIYVGKSNVPKERLRKINTIIQTENLSHIWPEPISIWFFWSRLESMRCSKTQYGKTVENDPVMKEIMVLLSYDGSDQGWVSVWRGQSERARANGQLAVLTLKEFPTWESGAKTLGLVPALGQELERRHTPQHCTRLILPGIGMDIPQKVVCTECGREMEKFFLFRCCID